MIKDNGARILFSVFFVLLALQNSQAQQKTISEKEKNERVAGSDHKVMVIPFEPRLYLGEMDYAFNAETKLSAKQIKFQFRDGLNEQIAKAFKKSKFAVLDLMEDTVKYKKDIEGIYHFLSYDYLKVPDQNNYKPPVKEKSQKNIEKGQLNVETNSDVRFMNAKLGNPKILTGLHNKYKTDLFVFINQLDIKSGASNEPSQPYKNVSSNRKIVVHYTVLNYEGKELNSGVLEDEFSQDMNVPKKIVEKNFEKIAQILVLRVEKALEITASN